MLNESATPATAKPRGIWDCPACGADNRPLHCLDADLIDQDDTALGTRCDDGFCVCGCQDCNPESCEKCGADL